MTQEMTGWPWHQLDHMQIICTSFQADNHAGTSSLNILQTGCSSWHPTNSVEALHVHSQKNSRKSTTIWVAELTNRRTDGSSIYPWGNKETNLAKFELSFSHRLGKNTRAKLSADTVRSANITRWWIADRLSTTAQTRLSLRYVLSPPSLRPIREQIPTSPVHRMKSRARLNWWRAPAHAYRVT